MGGIYALLSKIASEKEIRALSPDWPSLNRTGAVAASRVIPTLAMRILRKFYSYCAV
jgi:hypothetical protein